MKEILLGTYKIVLAGNKASLYKNDKHIISLNSASNISIDTFMDFIITPPVRPTFHSKEDRE